MLLLVCMFITVTRRNESMKLNKRSEKERECRLNKNVRFTSTSQPRMGRHWVDGGWLSPKGMPLRDAGAASFGNTATRASDVAQLRILRGVPFAVAAGALSQRHL